MDWTPANYARLKELRASGLTMRAIAKEFGLSRTVICRKLNRPSEPRAAKVRPAMVKPKPAKVPPVQPKPVKVPPVQRVLRPVRLRPVQPRSSVLPELSKPALRAMLAEAVRNTARL